MKLLLIVLKDILKLIAVVLGSIVAVIVMLAIFVSTVVFYTNQPYEVTHGLGYLAILKYTVLVVTGTLVGIVLWVSIVAWVKSCIERTKPDTFLGDNLDE